MSASVFAPVTNSTVSEAERKALVAPHHRSTTTVIHAPDGGVTEIETEPFCPRCGHAWGVNGCPTVRAVAALYQTERIAVEAKEREYAMRVELGALAVRGEWWKRQDIAALQIEYQIAASALGAGGIEIIDHSLRDIREQIAKALREPRTPAKASVQETP